MLQWGTGLKYPCLIFSKILFEPDLLCFFTVLFSWSHPAQVSAGWLWLWLRQGIYGECLHSCVCVCERQMWARCGIQSLSNWRLSALCWTNDSWNNLLSDASENALHVRSHRGQDDSLSGSRSGVRQGRHPAHRQSGWRQLVAGEEGGRQEHEGGTHTQQSAAGEVSARYCMKRNFWENKRRTVACLGAGGKFLPLVTSMTWFLICARISVDIIFFCFCRRLAEISSNNNIDDSPKSSPKSSPIKSFKGKHLHSSFICSDKPKEPVGSQKGSFDKSNQFVHTREDSLQYWCFLHCLLNSFQAPKVQKALQNLVPSCWRKTRKVRRSFTTHSLATVSACYFLSHFPACVFSGWGAKGAYRTTVYVVFVGIRKSKHIAVLSLSDMKPEEVYTYEEVEKCYPKIGRYRPIVLVGAQGVGRTELRKRLTATNPNHFKSTVPCEFKVIWFGWAYSCLPK